MEIVKDSEDYIRNYCFNRELSIARQGEEYIKHYFEEKRNTELVNHGGGYDFCNEPRDLFVEVKSSASKKPQGSYFTNSEFEKARFCRREKTKYEIHLVVGIGSDSPKHYTESVKVFFDQAKPEIWWYLTWQNGFDKDEHREREDESIP